MLLFPLPAPAGRADVISELMRPQPEPRVLAWADGRLPDGRRKQELQQSWDALMAEVFTGRVWPFTSEAAHWYAQLLQRREPLGRSMATAEALIAATALAQGASLATRDGADFADMGLELINPWYRQ